MQAQANPTGFKHWRLQTDADGIATLSIDKAESSVNSLSQGVMEELEAAITTLERATPKGLILTSAKRGFIAGADIKEFVTLQTPQQAFEMIRKGQRVLDRLAALKCTTVAAINGFALGGGFEIALACDYRVIVDDDSIVLGFPEVQLGLHPGFGGTVRSVQLAGPLAAMDLMLTGKNIRPKQAAKLHLVDRLVPAAELLATARQVAINPPAKPSLALKERLLNLPGVRSIVAGQMRTQVARKVRPAHYPAPYALIELWQRYGAKGEKAMDAEARSMSELLCTSTSRNLVRVFFLNERLKSIGKNAARPAKHVHVVGAGVMGGDIATWCAARGLTVTLQDRGAEFIAPAIERARAFFNKRYAEAPAKAESALSRLSADVEGNGVAQADVVIEAIFENLDAKRELYSRLEPKMKPDAVLATNTSSIVLEQLAEKLAQPARLIGLHFFNPVARMPLLEVIRAENSDPQMVQAGLSFARQIDKLAVPCRSSPGFLVNRVLMPYLNEAIRAAEEGVPLPVIDRAAEEFGMPMGPIELADVVGLDVIMSVGKVFFQAGTEVPTILSTRFQQKKFGKKTGQGFYEWRNDKPQKPPIGEGQTPLDLEDRLILPMINEAIAVLRENVVDDADLVDAGIIFGTGFAPFRGGPIQYARTRGVDAIVARLEELRQVYGERFAPDAGWQLLR
ncbi:MAG TPA: 3-hydroxyacyl-CoA dehydrogenase NAD-binding domain-containing protein [Steroidobacteraceae bacterium]|jgi:3-hydroxyacyl-CoA dehydrogenase/enoyl-CoA hydratase/3-hydroxybutyryl-CoA epimerase|nr:3-hydroxyacyl-CoA dehydrogenase NAD-binding domain-containing protein [Steroidobacteraceae bacterium]